MTHDEVAGYTLLAAYGILLLGAIRLFGLRRILMVILGIVFLAMATALGTLRGMTTRRY